MKALLISLLLLSKLLHESFAQTEAPKAPEAASPEASSTPAASAPKGKSEKTPEKKEFAEASYLQIDQLDVPKGIKRVEDQLRENVIDVIIHSKTHMPIFAQKREEGYSKDYKKFYSLNIRILPIKGDDDFFSLQLFYFNWTTNKFDKRLVRKISRYNVLNELRIATYEILLGKHWVMDHKDEIESRNFNRIQAVREVLNEQEKRRKKEQKEEEKKKEELEEQKKRKSERTLLKREEREKPLKKESVEEKEEEEAESVPKNKEDELSAQADTDPFSLEEMQNKKLASSANVRKKTKTSHLAEEPEAVVETPAPVFSTPPPPGIPKKSHLYGFANFFQEAVDINGILPTSTNLKYFGGGGRFILETQEEHPTGFRFSIQAATPIFKEEYKFPIYRGVESEYFISNLFGHLKIYGGLDYTPVYFVGLPDEGLRFQVYENDFLWAKIGAEVTGVLYERKVEARLNFHKSIASMSNQKGSFDATKLSFSLYSQIKNNHGAEINFSSMNADGPFQVIAKKVALAYVFKFEN